MGVMEEKGWNEFVGTIDWGNSLDVCMMMIDLVREQAPEEYEDVKGSVGDEKVVIYTLENVGMKRKISCTKATSKFVRTKRGQKQRR